MICPTCEYEFEPTGELQCPRCGGAVSCSAVTCADCDACDGVLEQVRRRAADRLAADSDE